MRVFFLYLFLVCFLFFIGLSFVLKFGRIEEISFETEGPWMKKEKIIKELKKKTHPYIGQWVWSLSIEKLKLLILSHPDVESIEIFRIFPNQFRIILPVDKTVLLFLGNKGLLPVTSKGFFKESLPVSLAPDLPILRGRFFFNHIESRKTALELLKHLPSEGLFSKKSVSEIKYSKKDKSFNIYLINLSSPIRIGENLSEFRPDRIESVLKYLKQNKINWRVMDARFSKKIIVNLKNF